MNEKFLANPTSLDYLYLQIFLVGSWAIILLDAYLNGVGGFFNSRGLNFLDSLGHSISWVSMSGDNVGMGARIGGALVTKYGSGTVVALLLGLTPSILLGWRQNVIFVLALLFAYRFPFLSRCYRTMACRYMFVACGGLYKSRKLWFNLSHARASPGWVQPLLIGILTVELTGWFAIFARRILRGYFSKSSTLIQPRFLLTLLATFMCYWEFPPFFITATLALHKYYAPFTFHH